MIHIFLLILIYFLCIHLSESFENCHPNLKDQYCHLDTQSIESIDDFGQKIINYINIEPKETQVKEIQKDIIINKEKSTIFTPSTIIQNKINNNKNIDNRKEEKEEIEEGKEIEKEKEEIIKFNREESINYKKKNISNCCGGLILGEDFHETDTGIPHNISRCLIKKEWNIPCITEDNKNCCGDDKCISSNSGGHCENKDGLHYYYDEESKIIYEEDYINNVVNKLNNLIIK